jgi:hypothetical protein
MGSLLTEGNHLFLAPETRRAGSSQWKDLLALLIEAVDAEAEACGAESVVLRDLPAGDEEMDALMLDYGFSSMPAPDSLVAELGWRDEAELLRGLTRKFRRHQLAEVKPWNDAYVAEYLGGGGRTPDAAELRHFYELYLHVKARSFDLNTFRLPRDIFTRMMAFPQWELISLRDRGADAPAGSEAPVAVVACFVGEGHYVPTLIGMDYHYVRSRGLYRQCLRHVLLRAKQRGLGRVLFGMGASLEKRRFGAKVEPRVYYVRADDHYGFDVIHQLGAGS